ncbi:MAG: c-type cytochrome [Pyrinomonadaceae bacterium]
MKRSFKIIIAVVFLFTGAIIFSGKIRAELAKTNSHQTVVNFSGQKSASAKTLYLNNCARCHGANGTADTELGKLYDAPNLRDRKVKKMSRKKMTGIIQNGDGSMPAFKKKLSAKETSALVNYIRTL